MKASVIPEPVMIDIIDITVNGNAEETGDVILGI